MIIHLDYETRSRCDLVARGQWNYSMDPSTSVMCVSYAFDDGPTRSAHPAFPAAGIPAKNWPPKDLIKAVQYRNNTVHAHNSSFEKYIWMNTTDWPSVLPYQWRCTLSVAAYYALPRSLGKCAEALGLPVKKDMKGNAAMKRCMRPNKDGDWHEDRQDLLDMFAYCDIDVEVERAIEYRLGQLPPYELAIWQFDQEMNERGIPFDRELAEIALETVEREKAQANIDIYRITDGMVETTTVIKTFHEWTEKMKYPLKGKSLDADHREIYLADPKAPEIVKDVIKLKASVSAASVNKYKKMLAHMDESRVVREGLRYFGAGTGRWAGMGVQVQNFPRGYGGEMEDVCDAIIDNDFDYVEFMYGDKPMGALKKATRGAIKAPEGKEILVTDYSSVEARGLFWFVDDLDAIEALKTACIYCDLATGIFGYQVIKGVHLTERQFGKQGVLGCGYQMGFPKFFITLEGYKIKLPDELVIKMLGDKLGEYKKAVRKQYLNITKSGIDFKKNFMALVGCKFIVDTYRTKYSKVKDLWKNLENDAVEAMQNPGVEIPSYKVKWLFRPKFDFLQCIMPSGRCINYYKPELRPTYTLTFQCRTKKGTDVPLRVTVDHIKGDELEKAKGTCKKKGLTLVTEEFETWENQKITYMKNGTTGFKRTSTYGGKLTENIIQGICRDIMAEGMIAVNKKFPVNMTVHDESCSVVDIGSDIDEYERILCILPKWAEGFPVGAESFRCKRYKK